MSGYYAKNPHYAPDDFSEDRERLERAEAQAGWYFANATKEQTAVFNRAMADLRGLSAPRYDRAREAAERAFKETTAAARDLCDATMRELLLTGEVSEALSYRWDELAVSGAMLEAAE
jgi:hypothetical protein